MRLVSRTVTRRGGAHICAHYRAFDGDGSVVLASCALAPGNKEEPDNLHVSLAKQFSNVPSPSQHEMQPVRVSKTDVIREPSKRLKRHTLTRGRRSS
eukprot:6184218-Pleurochrysis_carterae.AAC.1